MAIHRCRTCGTPCAGSWWCQPCRTPTPPHGAAPSDQRRRPNTTERGLGYDHQKARRAALKAHVDGDPCGYCGAGMWTEQGLDLDHAIARALGGDLTTVRLTHARCNRSAGGRLGHALRTPQTPTPRRASSREW